MRYTPTGWTVSTRRDHDRERRTRRFAEGMTRSVVRVRTIYADSLNHAKGVIADGTYGASFSANFDAQHGLDGPSLTMRFTGRRQAMQTSGTLQASSHPPRVTARRTFVRRSCASYRC